VLGEGGRGPSTGSELLLSPGGTIRHVPFLKVLTHPLDRALQLKVRCRALDPEARHRARATSSQVLPFVCDGLSRRTYPKKKKERRARSRTRDTCSSTHPSSAACLRDPGAGAARRTPSFCPGAAMSAVYLSPPSTPPQTLMTGDQPGGAASPPVAEQASEVRRLASGLPHPLCFVRPADSPYEGPVTSG
jgi:hypothetical protein